MLARIAPKTFSYIHNTEALESLVQRLETVEAFAVDTEGDSLHHYFEKVCLIQITTNGSNFLVDPLADIDLARLLEVLSEKQIILHDANHDLRMMRNSFQFRPKGKIFDTMLAAQLLGYKRLGLVAMVEIVFGVSLSKKGQKSDWSRRPLKDMQLQYAIDDTRFLEPLAAKLRQALQQKGRLAWHAESCLNMIQNTESDTVRDSEKIWRIKGWQALSRRELLFLKAIWHWRESQAKKADLPSFKVMGNSKIIELASWTCSNPHKRLVDGPSLPRHIRGARFRTLLKSIKEAKNTPKSQWPSHRIPSKGRALPPVTEKKLTKLKTQCAHLGKDLGLAPSIVAPKASLVSIVRERPQTIDELMSKSSLMRWQAELIMPIVEQID